jgi:hypothetical protein
MASEVFSLDVAEGGGGGDGDEDESCSASEAQGLAMFLTALVCGLLVCARRRRLA